MRWLLRTLHGHYWTVVPDVVQRLAPTPVAGSRWSMTVDDPQVGAVTLRGFVRHEPDADALAIIVHGLGGDAQSPYCCRAASAFGRRGWSTLRISLRGADQSGEDVYHAGLVEDLEAMLRAPELAHYRRIVVVGYSLGGHVVLRHALQPTDSRVRAVAAVCAPLDLARSCLAIDRRRSFVYRHYVLTALKRAYLEVAARREVPTPVHVVQRLRTIRGWDDAVVVPRHGFDSVDHYYTTQSVGPRLHELQLPAMWLGSRHDPMVPAWTVEPSLSEAPDRLVVHMLDRGGHVGFPPHIHLGNRATALEDHIADWLTTQ